MQLASLVQVARLYYSFDKGGYADKKGNLNFGESVCLG